MADGYCNQWKIAINCRECSDKEAFCRTGDKLLIDENGNYVRTAPTGESDYDCGGTTCKRCSNDKESCAWLPTCSILQPTSQHEEALLVSPCRSQGLTRSHRHGWSGRASARICWGSDPPRSRWSRTTYASTIATRSFMIMTETAAEATQ